MAKRIRSLDPIINENSRVLILGTMPGPESLRRRQYYANQWNLFWRIIYRVLGKPGDPPSDYENRVRVLRENGIALWDVLESCERDGASDSKIRKGRPNDFKTLLRKNPSLRRIFSNGKKAEQCFKLYGCARDVECLGLPSTSPANARMSLDEKISRWSVMRHSL